ncbi:CGNR zinc finger domain-containing protein [Sphingomonas sp. DT-204]|uniref:CGNR zinc finger domain-containing protein n=1 Tax=Sphingomonas sp. DT-204 TaxID=3396166 RepID=UPI003F1D018D
MLDLVATLAGRLKSEPRELLATPADLDRWLAAAGFGGDGAAGPDDLDTARELREAIHRLATASTPTARETVNRLAAGPAAVPLLLDEAGGYRLEGTTEMMLAMLARETVLLFGGPQRDRIKGCEAQGCAILFLDQSRKGDRRWCSMRACGNKAKIAEFRRRRRGG